MCHETEILKLFETEETHCVTRTYSKNTVILKLFALSVKRKLISAFTFHKIMTRCI